MSSSKVIVITGASSGIGAALAERLGGQGHRLALAARREEELTKVAERSGAGALAVVTDVRRRSDVENLRDRTVEAFGHVDVWVNNAGRGIGKRVLDLTDEDFDEMFTVNTKSALYGMQAIVPHFMARGAGHLINISSFLGRVPVATVRSAYSAAKAALNSLTANLRMDLRQEYPDIQVSLVMPGIVLTEFARNALGGTPGTAPPAGAMKPQTVDEAVAAIAGVIDQPVPEMYTNPALAEVARRYYEDVAAFEAGFGGPPARS
jgi:NADP-dependent 3-hydroxy acid dehydrogenase YdfG